MYINPQYRQDLFKGTSNYYSQYRTPYPKSLISDVIKVTNIEPNDKLLDLACGPGRLAIPLSKYFKEVYAVDWEQEMIEEGERISKNKKINNIKWISSKAEELNLEPEILKLITIGDAFHRLDQLRILQNSYKMLIKGGSLVLIYSESINKGDSAWQKELMKVLSPWYSISSQKIKVEFNGQQFDEMTLKEFGFINTSSKLFEETVTVDIEEIIGYLYSMSVYSKQIIGDRHIEFEKSIKERLLKIEPENRFKYIFRCGYYIGKKD